MRLGIVDWLVKNLENTCTCCASSTHTKCISLLEIWLRHLYLIAFRRETAYIHVPDPSLLCGSGSGLRDQQQHLQGSLKFVDNKVTQAKASSDHTGLTLQSEQYPPAAPTQLHKDLNLQMSPKVTDSCRIISVLSYTTSMEIIPGSLIPKLSCTRVLKQCYRVN